MYTFFCQPLEMNNYILKGEYDEFWIFYNSQAYSTEFEQTKKP